MDLLPNLKLFDNLKSFVNINYYRYGSYTNRSTIKTVVKKDIKQVGKKKI